MQFVQSNALIVQSSVTLREVLFTLSTAYIGDLCLFPFLQVFLHFGQHLFSSRFAKGKGKYWGRKSEMSCPFFRATIAKA